MQRKEFRAMGSRILALLEEGRETAPDALPSVPLWFEGWEETLSRFRPESELSRLNHSLTGDKEISPVLGAVIEAALQAALETGGLCHPLLLDAVVGAGYDRPFNPAATEERPQESAPPTVPDWRAIRLDRSRRRVRIPAGGRLDLGGIAKGWAADTGAARLGGGGSALVDAGGDISVSGPRRDGSPWPVGVTNPFIPEEPLCTIALAEGGVATSGRDYRRWIRQGRPSHHIIDPRTLRPAETDVLTATVIAPNTRRAESAAKAAVILGSERGIEWLDQNPDLAGMLVLQDGRIVYSQHFKDFVW
jgi:thiamine biosynthesis lipoprotein